MTLTAFIILSLIFITSSIMPFIKKEYWWIRGFDFPHVQFTVLGIACLVISLFTLEFFSQLHYLILALVVLGLTYKLWIIYPYTFFHSLAVPAATQSNQKSRNSISLLISNVYMENINYTGFIELVKENDPDVVFMLETDMAWMENINSFMKDRYSYHILHPLENTYGLLFYSKLKLENDQIRFLIEEDVPSISVDLIFPDNEKVKLLGLHPKPPSPTENEESTPRDAELIVAGREARKCLYPVVIAGDMNDVAWSHTTRLFARISGLLDLRIGRGFFNTFHAKYPLLRWPLDHVFVSQHFKLIRMKRLKNFNSDHFPIYAELLIEASKEALGNVEHPDKMDIEEADQKIEGVS